MRFKDLTESKNIVRGGSYEEGRYYYDHFGHAYWVCYPRYAEMTDQELIAKWNQLHYGKAIVHDALWSMGFMSLKYWRHRTVVATELKKRGYAWKDTVGLRIGNEWGPP